MFERYVFSAVESLVCGGHKLNTHTLCIVLMVVVDTDNFSSLG